MCMWGLWKIFMLIALLSPHATFSSKIFLLLLLLHLTDALGFILRFIDDLITDDRDYDEMNSWIWLDP